MHFKEKCQAYFCDSTDFAAMLMKIKMGSASQPARMAGDETFPFVFLLP